MLTASFFAAGPSAVHTVRRSRFERRWAQATRIPAAALLAGVLAAGAAASPGPGAGVAALLERLQLSSNPQHLDWLHMRAIETWDQDGPGGVDRETDDVIFYHAVPLELEAAHNGRLLGTAARARQRQAASALRRRIDRALAARGGQNAKLLNLDGEIWTLARFVAQFNWTAGAATRPGTAVLEFRPRPGPSHTRVQTLLRHTAGSFTVDAATGQVISGEFHSLGHVNFGGGLLAHFTAFRGSFELQPLGGCWVMRRIEVHVDGRRLLHRIHGTEIISYAPAAAGAAAPAPGGHMRR